MGKIRVRPNRDKVPPHPHDGVLGKDGGLWTADQYTYRLIRDGVISEVVEEAPPPEKRTYGHAGDDPPPPGHNKPKAKGPL